MRIGVEALNDFIPRRPMNARRQRPVSSEGRNHAPNLQRNNIIAFRGKQGRNGSGFWREIVGEEIRHHLRPQACKRRNRFPGSAVLKIEVIPFYKRNRALRENLAT
jgi:hypothetical protein